MTLDDLQITVAPANGTARRLVVAMGGGRELHRDTLATDSATARKRFLQDVAQAAGLPAAEVVTRWNAELPRLADAADAAAAEAAQGGQPPPNDPFEIGRGELEGTPQAVRNEAERMARNPELLREVYADLTTLGLAGEAELAITCWLVGVSRVLTDPLAAVIIGATSSGKSYVLRRVADLFPPEAVLRVTQATPQAWFYLPPGSLKHRFVVLGERPQGDSPEVVDANRSWRELVSEGRLVKAVAVKTSEGMATQVVVQEGPIAFCESTTKARLLDEDASRLLLLNSDDSAEQTARVVSKMFKAEARPKCVDRQAIIAKHHVFQRLLGRPQVVIPFAERLALEFPTERPECRRIARNVVAMVKASAVAHQFQRPRQGEAVVADPADYAVAWRLLRGPAARLLGREPHASVKRLAAQLRERFGDGEFTTVQAAEAGGVSRRWAGQGLRWLAENGYTEQTNPGGGPKPATWRLTNPLEEGGVLPAPEEVFS